MSITAGLKIIVAAGLLLAAAATTYWFMSSRSTTLSSYELLQKACDSAEFDQYYDLSVRIHMEAAILGLDTDIQMEFRLAGDDWHATVTEKSQEGVVEDIWLDGIGYSRNSQDGPEWKLSSLEDQTNPFAPSQFVDVPACPDVSEFREEGVDVWNGQRVRRFTNKPLDAGVIKKPVGDGLSTEETSYESILVGADGRMAALEATSLHQTVSDGGEVFSTVRVTGVMSNFNEPNVITAPTLP